MVLKIWKFVLDGNLHSPNWEVMVPIPSGAAILDVGVSQEQIVLWALCDSKAIPEEREFRIYGTGTPIDQAVDLNYVGRVATRGFKYQWHIFEVVPAQDSAEAANEEISEHKIRAEQENADREVMN